MMDTDPKATAEPQSRLIGLQNDPVGKRRQHVVKRLGSHYPRRDHNCLSIGQQRFL